MIRILSGDILIADVIVSLEGNPSLAALVEKYHLKPGGKEALDDTRLAEFSAAAKGHGVTVTPGGSSANMLATLGKLMGKDVEVRFLGVAGEGLYSGMIRDSLEEAGIALLPEHLPGGQAAVSFVMVGEGGQCTIATHPGNARDLLKLSVISEDRVRECDVLLVQGSLWHKFERGFPDRMIELCRKHAKELWLTLPTQTKFSEDDARRFQQLIPHASLVLGNESELVRVYGAAFQAALVKLQMALGKPSPKEGKGKRAVGFITSGKTGAAIVTGDGIEYVAPMPIEARDIVNTLGAGDTSFAGFAAGYLRGLPTMACAQIAMALAEEKLRINNPRLAAPMAVMKEAFPNLARMLKND